jgi:hypothetical protein
MLMSTAYGWMQLGQGVLYVPVSLGKTAKDKETARAVLFAYPMVQPITTFQLLPQHISDDSSTSHERSLQMTSNHIQSSKACNRRQFP